jgi:hypothetical protein
MALMRSDGTYVVVDRVGIFDTGHNLNNLEVRAPKFRLSEFLDHCLIGHHFDGFPHDDIDNISGESLAIEEAHRHLRVPAKNRFDHLFEKPESVFWNQGESGVGGSNVHKEYVIDGFGFVHDFIVWPNHIYVQCM